MAMDPEEKKRLEAEQTKQLTGLPLEIDQINFAIPVIAPYSAVMNYKYKVKVTPGSDKCGKAVKTAMLVFSKIGDPRSKEAQYVKAVPDTESTRAMPGNVKVSAAGLEKASKGSKGGGKKKR